MWWIIVRIRNFVFEQNIGNEINVFNFFIKLAKTMIFDATFMCETFICETFLYVKLLSVNDMWIVLCNTSLQSATYLETTWVIRCFDFPET